MLGPLLTRLDRWARDSQQVARRNAMVASTEAVRRRAEREEAESVVASAVASYAAGGTPERATAAR